MINFFKNLFYDVGVGLENDILIIIARLRNLLNTMIHCMSVFQENGSLAYENL
jgi:hypothetical protein